MKLARQLIRNPSLLTLLAVLLGGLLSQFEIRYLPEAAQFLAEVFIRCLRLLSTPIIFLSLVVTLAGIESPGRAGKMLLSVLRYTLLTTLLAATGALALFLYLDPVQVRLPMSHTASELGVNYLQHLSSMVPVSFVAPFVEGNVMAVLVLALMLSFALLCAPPQTRSTLLPIFRGLHAIVMILVSWLVRVMPLAVFAFAYGFLREWQAQSLALDLARYLQTLILANLLQAVVVLPLFLLWHGLSPLRVMVGMMPALSVAFFSKSSAATMPVAIDSARERLGVSAQVANFCFPLCTTINMNACAAFILITVLFVAQSHGLVFSAFDLLAWVLIATLAAVGNAGVPMGCYFLTSALLSTLNVPLTLLAMILPLYALIDMLETAINVWSDACVTMVVEKEHQGCSENDIAQGLRPARRLAFWARLQQARKL